MPSTTTMTMINISRLLLPLHLAPILGQKGRKSLIMPIQSLLHLGSQTSAYMCHSVI